MIRNMIRMNTIIIMRILVVFDGFLFSQQQKFLLQTNHKIMQPQINIEQSENICNNQQQFEQQDQHKQQQYFFNIHKDNKDQQNERQLLRNIGCRKISNYITNSIMKKKLGYAQQCCQSIDLNLKIMDKNKMMNESYQYTFDDLVGLDCQMIRTNNGGELCRIAITNLNRVVLYDRWFGIKQDSHIIDLLTPITGINQQVYQKNIHNKPPYSSTDKEQIQNIIHGKIVVGHDLANDIQLLGIKHQIFIDTVALLPHHLGLPFKNKLKDLTFQYLKKHIHWGAHDPFEDCLCALEITKKHIKQGRGTIQIQPFPQYTYQQPDSISKIDFQKILKHAEIQIEKVLFFVLRGSRTLGIQVQNQFYTSDWDYVLVYDTESQIDGRLIKLPNIDISFFDKNSFQRHLLNNDISYLQIFFVPQKYKLICKIDFPFVQIDIMKLRGTLGFHLNRSRMKIKRFSHQMSNIKFKWKILKAQHLQIRFMQLFLQLNQVYSQFNTKIQKNNQQQILQKIKNNLQKMIDIKKMNNIWHEIQEQFQQKGNFIQLTRKLQKIQAHKMKQVNAICRHTKGLRYRGEKDMQKRSNYQNAIIKEYSNHGKGIKKQLNQIHLKLQTVKFLQNHSIQQLQNLKIICKRHKFYPNLMQFHYMQSSDFINPISKQCRGLILDLENSFQIVALPYYKFHDYNDPKYSQLDKIDWDSAKIYEKKDGSMAFMYFYHGNWHVASSTIPDGTNNYCFAKQQTTVQFKKQFWAIFYELGFILPNIEDQSKTFIFEMMSKNHIIVVKRTHSSLCLHGVRDLRTLEEQDHIIYGKKYNWIVAFPLQIPKQQLNIQCLVKRVQLLDPLKSEGYVVCDRNWRRMKIKNSSYVRINWLGELNLGYNKDPKKFILIEIILSGEADTFSKYCPQWEKTVKEFQIKIGNLNQRVIQVYEKTKHLSQRQLAQQIKKYQKTFQALIFAIRNNPQKYYGKIQTVLNPKKFYTYISSQK